MRRVQPRGGARWPRARRTLCTLSVRTRAPYLRRWALIIALRRAEDGRALLGEGAESLCGIGGAHVLGDEIELEREAFAQVHVEPAVDERLDRAVAGGALVGERGRQLVHLRLEAARRRHAVHEPPVERLGGPDPAPDQHQFLGP